MKKIIAFIWVACMGYMLSPDLTQNQPPLTIETPEPPKPVSYAETSFPEKHPATSSLDESMAQLEKETEYWELILKASQEHQIEPALIKAIIMAESSYNPRAESKRGAKGLMQLMPNTAQALGIDDIYDPSHNINGGTKYFRFLLDKFNGNVNIALAAYNAGLTNVQRYNGIPPFESTRQYIKKVALYRKYYRKQVAWRLNLV